MNGSALATLIFIRNILINDNVSHHYSPRLHHIGLSQSGAAAKKAFGKPISDPTNSKSMDQKQRELERGIRGPMWVTGAFTNTRVVTRDGALIAHIIYYVGQHVYFVECNCRAPRTQIMRQMAGFQLKFTTRSPNVVQTTNTQLVSVKAGVQFRCFPS